MRENSKTSAKVAQMFELAFDFKVDKEKREAAMNNLLVLAKEKAGADLMYKAGMAMKIHTLLKTEKNENIIIATIRILAELCKDNIERTEKILQDIGIPWFLDIINSKSEDRVNAAQYCIQVVLNSYSKMDNKPDSKPDKEYCEKYKKEIDTILSSLLFCTTNRTFTGEGRDAVIEIIMRNIHYDALNWAERLVELGGLQRLMEVASELEEYKYESAMNITSSTRTVTSVCLARIYENMYYDAAKQRFVEAIDEFIKDKLISPDIESKVRVVVAITTLLLGPLDVGNNVVAKDGILQMILVMAGTDDILQQKVACECIIAAASKKDKATSIINQGVNILKKLYQSKDDSIRVRALVGLCKLSSSGGTDVSIRPFADGASKNLLKLKFFPEMLELAKFAKHHIPEESELDDPDFVAKRVIALAKAGVTSALVSLSKTDSKNSKELIARIFNAICAQVDVRGTVVQQGGAKALIPLALDGTDKGKKTASQALARLGITINPEVAFPGQRIYEVIRPLINLLSVECSALENFESMMALCNLAGVNDLVRKRILKEGGFPKIENYMYEEHDLLRRAATQCINNLMMCEDTIKLYDGDNDRTKYLVVLCEEEDLDTCLAASGALAMLTGVCKAACCKIFDSKNWLDAMKYLLANPNQDVQHRGVVIINNIMNCSKDVATRIVQTDIMEVLMALTKSELVENQKIKKLAMQALEAAANWKLMEKCPESSPVAPAPKQVENALDKVE
ncbi:unnamed protein product [Trichogramma brassicae]|uniref:UNC-45/Cro1/She4 central domain-containing protein n=1 Tax=Trichogramma brassicae TaxID=86971 RepID=A0A6H5I7W1_9HYME|nr:unnamed protein product [Trichogramma brassicae]